MQIDAKRALDALMQTGQFRDISEAVAAAIINYEVIQKAVARGEQIQLGQASPQSHAELRSEAPVVPQTRGVPSLFATPTCRVEDIGFLPLVPPLTLVECPPTEWMFGQYNKFLPIKATCRGIFNLMARNGGSLPLSTAVQEISKVAPTLGEMLLASDRRSSRSREDLYSAAFPKSSDEGTGGLSRFASQFVGDIRQARQVGGERPEPKFEGFLAELQFAKCTTDRNPVLTLTRPGAEFAAFNNPILDGTAVDEKLAVGEVQFLLQHIQACVPHEASAYNSIIDAILAGANTPETLDQYLCKRFRLEIAMKAENENQLTQTFLTTQRTGALSRMNDLGLISRVKVGLRVTYGITDSARQFRSQ